MAVVGIPQFLNVNFIAYGSGATEVDISHLNGLDKTSVPYNVTNLTCTVTAGPTTAGPIFVGYNGIMAALPFNAGNLSIPKYIIDQLSTAGGWTAS